jgi:transcriptional regulator with XRE-family HTH domain
MDPESRLLTHRQRLAAALLKIRTAANLTTRALAERISISQSKVSRIESGRVLPTAEEVTAWTHATSADQAMLNELLEQLDAALTEFAHWQVGLRDGVSSKQERIRELETAAAAIHNYQVALIPGLLQTAEYARRVFQLTDVVGSQDFARAVAKRIDRQQVIYDESRQFEFLITEQALRARIGPPGLIAPQLDRIGQISTLSNVVVGLIPSVAEVTALVMHAFVLFEPSEDEQSPFVVVELAHGEVIISDPKDIKLYQDRLSLLREMAVFGDAARALLASIGLRVALVVLAAISGQSHQSGLAGDGGEPSATSVATAPAAPAPAATVAASAEGRPP